MRLILSDDLAGILPIRIASAQSFYQEAKEGDAQPVAKPV